MPILRRTPLRGIPPRRSPLPAESAASRTTAYVYGNVIVLAALVPLSEDELLAGTAILIVLGTALSTFLAHLFAATVGAGMGEEQPSGWKSVRHHVRNAVPVLTAGFVPAALLVLVWLELASSTPVVIAAEVLLVLRIGSTGMVATRLRGEPSSLRSLLIGVAFSLVGAAVVAIKVVLTH